LNAAGVPLQDSDEDASQRRRLSQRGLRSPEQPLQREMVDHVVDALFHKCAPER
jgi:hypothetical protein